MNEINYPYLPGNLENIRKREDQIRTESILSLNSDIRLMEGIGLIHTCSNVIFEFTISLEDRNEDEKTIQLLGIRFFNSIASSMMLLLSGFDQSSVMLMRDIIETGFLLDYFTMNTSKISDWRNSNRKERERKYKSSIIRNALDKRDGFKVSKREHLYRALCEYGTHPTHPGVLLVAPDQSARIGPFFESRFLNSLIVELTIRVPYITIIYISLFDNLSPRFLEIKSDFLSKIKTWSIKYFGVDLGQIDPVRRKDWIIHTIRSAKSP